MAAIDDETIMLYPCLVHDGEVTFLSSQLQSQGIFAFFSPCVDPADALFYALAITVEGAATPRDSGVVVMPAVVRFADAGFRGMSDMWQLAPFDEDRFRHPQRVDVHPSGTVYVTEWSRVYRYSPEGEYQNVLPLETFPTDQVSVTLQLATGDGTPDGVIGLGTCHSGANDLPCLGYFTITTQSWRWEEDDWLEPQWTTTMPKDISASPGGWRQLQPSVYEMHFDQVNDLVLILDNEAQQLLAYPRLGRGRKDAWNLGGTDRTALYADVASGPDGRIYVLDVLRDEIQVRGSDGDLIRRLKSPTDSWRIAGGPDGTIFVLTAFGEVVRLDERGAEEARFDVRPNENAQPRNLSDVSVAAFNAARQVLSLADFKGAPTGPRSRRRGADWVRVLCASREPRLPGAA